MRSTQYLAAIATLVAPSFAQTFTDCNPLEKTCPANPALGKAVSYDFTKGAPPGFTSAAGRKVDFGSSQGGVFSISKTGEAPTLSSDWYFMFGNVKVVMKPSPGAGIVSSVVLESIDLDEVDYEWVGNDLGTIQTNYFGKGNTTVYDRGANFPDPESSDGFNTYEIDWTSEHIQWIVNNKVIRTLTPATAHPGQYPQTPMQLKLGNWAGGDSKDEGTRTWAGGRPDYSKGPFNMIVKSINVADYSTGTEYSYSDNSGSWQSIRSKGGKINNKGVVPADVSTASAVGTTVTGKPTASAITQQNPPTTTEAVPTGQFGTGTGTGVAAPTNTRSPTGNATVGTTPTSSGSGSSPSSSTATGAGSIIKPAAGLLAAGLLAIMAL